MATPLTKETLEHLAKLARIELDGRSEEKQLHDLEKILKHFEELSAVDTENVLPMNGGTLAMNVFRDDTERENTNRGKGKESFPETHNEYLVVPPIL